MSQFEENRKKDFPKKFSLLVNDWEKQNGKHLSQEYLARQILVARETVNSWSTGKSYPSEENLSAICKFFKVTLSYFYGDEGWTIYDESTHAALNSDCEKVANHIGLSEYFVRFVKENPALSDAVIEASCFDGVLQTLDPAVPAVPENVYQFVSSTGSKIYPSEDALQILRSVQQEAVDYILFLIRKYEKFADEKRKERSSSKNTEFSTGLNEFGEICTVGNQDDKEYPRPAEYLALARMGRGDLVPSESLMIDVLRRLSNKNRHEMYKQAALLLHEDRKKGKSQEKGK